MEPEGQEWFSSRGHVTALLEVTVATLSLWGVRVSEVSMHPRMASCAQAGVCPDCPKETTLGDAGATESGAEPVCHLWLR